MRSMFIRSQVSASRGLQLVGSMKRALWETHEQDASSTSVAVLFANKRGSGLVNLSTVLWHVHEGGLARGALQGSARGFRCFLEGLVATPELAGVHAGTLAVGHEDTSAACEDVFARLEFRKVKPASA